MESFRSSRIQCDQPPRATNAKQRDRDQRHSRSDCLGLSRGASLWHAGVVGAAVRYSIQHRLVSAEGLARRCTAFVLDGGLRVDHRWLTLGRDLRVASSVFGRHVGLGRCRGHLVPDLGVHRDQSSNRRSLDRIGDDGLHGGVVAGHGNDPWKHFTISCHDSCCFDESCRCNRVDSGANRDLLGDVSVGAADGNR